MRSRVFVARSAEAITADDADVARQWPSAHLPLRERVRPRRAHGRGSKLMPAAAKTASNAEVNFASRSRMRNLTDAARSPSSIIGLRVLGHPLAGGWAMRRAGALAGCALDDEQHVKARVLPETAGVALVGGAFGGRRVTSTTVRL